MLIENMRCTLKLNYDIDLTLFNWNDSKLDEFMIYWNRCKVKIMLIACTIIEFLLIQECS